MRTGGLKHQEVKERLFYQNPGNSGNLKLSKVLRTEVLYSTKQVWYQTNVQKQNKMMEIN